MPERDLHVGEGERAVAGRHVFLAPDAQQEIEHALVQHFPRPDLLLDHVEAGAFDVKLRVHREIQGVAMRFVGCNYPIIRLALGLHVGGPDCLWQSGERHPLNLMRVMPSEGSVARDSPAIAPPPQHSQGANMNANPKFLSATARVDEAAVKPLPNSRKVYVAGSRSDIRVPMREIRQSDTPLHSGAAAQGGAAARSEPNPPIFVYDTSGPYTDPRRRSTSGRGCSRCGRSGSSSETIPRSSRGRPRATGASGSLTQAGAAAIQPRRKATSRNVRTGT